MEETADLGGYHRLGERESQRAVRHFPRLMGVKGGLPATGLPLWPGSFIRGPTPAHICYLARSATAKNSAMAIAAGLIWRAIFAFIGIRFTFSFGKFFRRCKIFEIRVSVADYKGSRHGQKEKETAEQDRPYRAVAPATAH